MLAVPWQVYRNLPRRLPLENRHSRYCLFFDRSSTQYIDVTDDPSLVILNAISIEAWIRLTVLGNRNIIYSDWNFGANRRNVYFWIENNNRVEFGISEFGAGADVVDSAPTTLTTGRFYHVAGVFDGDWMYVYLNGEEVGSNNTALTALFGLGNQKFVGRYAANYMDGSIDEFRILPIALTAQQVRESFLRGYARRELDARLIYRFEEGSGLATADASGYGNTGTLQPGGNPPTWTRNQKWELLVDAGL